MSNYRETYLEQDIRNLVKEDKIEVDIVIQTPERLLPIEIKSDKRVQSKYLKGLRSFLDKENEQIGILAGKFYKADILEENR